MGRGQKIRRGYSLEVIFEEDPDFCSHLDSLDSVAIRFGVKDTDDTISVDSLVEEYRIRFQGRADKEHVYRSLDGIWDVRDMDTCFVEWDEFSSDSVSVCKMAPGGSPKCEFDSQKSPQLEGGAEVPSSGRRSRVSRRQIVEASWVFDSDDNDSNGSNNDNDNTETTQNLDSKNCTIDEPEIEPVLTTQNIRPLIQQQPTHLLPIDIRLGLDPNSNNTETRGGSATVQLGPSPALFGNVNNFCRIIDGAEKDTLDSYMSTRTDDTETNAYTFADSDHFDSSSVASTAYDSSTSSTSSTGSVIVNGCSSGSPKIIPVNITNSSNKELESKFKTNLSKELNSRFASVMEDHEKKSRPSREANPSELGTTDVKKVRALFETSSGSRKSSLGEDSNASTSSGSNSSQRIYSRNPSSPTNSNGIVGGVHKKLMQLGSNSSIQNQAVGKVLRSAYSQFNLTAGGSGVDFAELLVNDRVVIEDSPDLFQTLRKSRHKGNGQRDSGFSTLRRSRSMGTGLAAIEASLSPSDKLNGLKTSKNNILAEEMPAPDTVKNVRTVFEQILKSRNSNEATNQINTSNGNCSFSIVKKSLSSVKSNPSSKIYRSESMRDDFPSSSGSTSLLACRRFGKPILVNESSDVSIRDHSVSPIPGETSPKKKCGTWRHALVERQHSEPIKFSPKINCLVRPRDSDFEQIHPTLDEESLSLLSSLNDGDDDPPKFVSPEILQRIRNCGSTTTYFGGQVIAQSGRNRRQIPVARRHTLMDFKEFNPADGDFYSNSSRSNTSCSNASNRTTPVATPTPSRSSLSPSKYELSEEYYTPPPIPTPIHEDLCMDGFITIENDQVIVPRPKLLPRRISPELEDVFTLGSSTIDTTPRIISVLPKSPSGSPTKSASPVGSIIEGRGTPEGCEGQENKCVWSNEILVGEDKFQVQDRNNNNLEVNVKTPSHMGVLGHHNLADEASEGAWF